MPANRSMNRKNEPAPRAAGRSRHNPSRRRNACAGRRSRPGARLRTAPTRCLASGAALATGAPPRVPAPANAGKPTAPGETATMGRVGRGESGNRSVMTIVQPLRIQVGVGVHRSLPATPRRSAGRLRPRRPHGAYPIPPPSRHAPQPAAAGGGPHDSASYLRRRAPSTLYPLAVNTVIHCSSACKRRSGAVNVHATVLACPRRPCVAATAGRAPSVLSPERQPSDFRQCHGTLSPRPCIARRRVREPRPGFARRRAAHARSAGERVFRDRCSRCEEKTGARRRRRVPALQSGAGFRNARARSQRGQDRPRRGRRRWAWPGS